MAASLALGALGVTLVYSILRFSNFAHGETMSFGAMIAILFMWAFQSAGIGIGPLPTVLLTIPLAILLTVGVLLLTDRWVYRFYRRQKAAPVVLLIASTGVMFLMNGIVRFIIGPDDQRVSDGARFLMSAREFKAWTGAWRGSCDQDQSGDLGCRGTGLRYGAVLVPESDPRGKVHAGLLGQ